MRLSEDSLKLDLGKTLDEILRFIRTTVEQARLVARIIELAL